MVPEHEVVEAAKTIVEYCKQQKGCKKCFFNRYGLDMWFCAISALEIKEALERKEEEGKTWRFM